MRSQRVVVIIVLAVFSAACSAPNPTTPSDDSTTTTIDPLVPGATLESGFTASPPSERWVEGTLEFNEWLVTCAEEHGEVVTLMEGLISGALPNTDRGRDIVQDCWDLAIQAGWAIQIPTGEEGQRLEYRLLIEVHECMVEAGYPTVEPPTEDAWVDAGMTGQSGRWNPYRALGGAPMLFMGGGPHTHRDMLNLRAQEECGGYMPELYQAHLRRQDG